MRRWSVIPFIAAMLFLPFLFGGCDEDIKYYQWNLVQLDAKDYVCGNGSPYKFFVNPSLTSDNVLIYFEAGGACWDYDSCWGQAGSHGAANPNGIPDDYMEGFSIPAIMSPFIFRAHPWERVDTQDWTLIFVPYCTGDLFIGDKTETYPDDDTEASLEWHHNGFKNTQGILDWMTKGPFKRHFDSIPKLMVTGCSAGGAGSILNYHFIRQALGDRVDEAILLNDSGPIYYTTMDNPPEDPIAWTESHWSGPLHDKITEAWGIDNIIKHLGEDFLENFIISDIGTINTALSREYPHDKLAHTQFTMDGNYSSYSYERFYEDPDLHTMWADDQAYLMAMYDYLYSENKNTGYFIPYYRPYNDSHCTCIFSFDDTDITGTDLDMGDYANRLLHSRRSMANMRIYEEPSEEELNRPYLFWDLVDLLMGAL